MLDSERYREFRNGKRYYTSIESTMIDNGSIEENLTGTSSENVEGEVSFRDSDVDPRSGQRAN